MAGGSFRVVGTGTEIREATVELAPGATLGRTKMKLELRPLTFGPYVSYTHGTINDEERGQYTKGVVGGKEVILTQDKNIVRGNKLSIDMATGQSVIITDGVTAAVGAAKPGRASVLFYPQERQKGTVTPAPTVAPVKPALFFSVIT